LRAQNSKLVYLEADLIRPTKLNKKDWRETLVKTLLKTWD